jgi:hypothetical protein
MQTITDNLASWWQQPFDARGSVVDWMLFVGLILIAAFLWSRVIARIG